MTDSRWTYGQYRIVQVLLGAYLVVHFAHLLPWGAEVFALGGMVSSAALSPLMGVLPNPLSWNDTAAMVTLLLVTGSVCGLLLVFGHGDRLAAALAAAVLAWLYARNPLIANPSLPVVGWLLVFHACLPRPRTLEERMQWRLPGPLYAAAWVLLAVAYTYSGYTKLLSPAWITGDAIGYVLQNPLARDHFLREWLLGCPRVLEWLTWGVLFLELLFGPLAFFSRLRPWLWTGMLGAQIGFLVFLNFADLTLPMLLIHLLTFDPHWLSGERSRAVLYYDGECGLCHGLVRLAALEDTRALIRFSPLQSANAWALGIGQIDVAARKDTIVLIDDEGRATTRSTAVIGILQRMGGLWSALGIALRLVPTPLRDLAYDAVGRVRRTLAAHPEGLCPLVPAGLRPRWLNRGPARV